MAKTVLQFEQDIAQLVKGIVDADMAKLAGIAAQAPFGVIDSYASAISRSRAEVTTAIGVSFIPFGPETYPIIVNSQMVAAIDFYKVDLRPQLKNSVFRVTCILNTTTAKLQVMIKGAGSQTAIKGILNNSTALAVDGIFTFDIPVHNGFKYNFQVDTTTIVNFFSIMELTP